MDVLKINGEFIAYRHRPALGRTIVFANSLGSNQSIWDGVIEALPTGYGILTYDLPGHGQSSGTASSIEALADDLSQLIDALGLTDLLFCGVSIGGMIGQVIASRRADVICAAVLCNTAPQIGNEERWQTRIKAVKEKGLDGLAPEITNTWFGPEHTAQTDRLAMYENMISRNTAAGYIAACEAIQNADLRPFARDIKIPTLCIGGTHDRSVPPASVEALALLPKNAEAEILDGIGHLPCLEAPKKLAELICAFDPKPRADHAQGMATRRAVLGDGHVDRAAANSTDLDQAFQQLITTGAWGQVWSSPGISARERSMLTLALLAATGNFDEIPMHVRATLRTGASEKDIAETMQHVAIYTGVPSANHALKQVKATLAEMASDD